MTTHKRSLDSFRDVSPPQPRKRRVRESAGDASKPAGESLTIATPERKETEHLEDLQIFSWNVNGIGPLIQRPITSFFGTQSGAAPPIRAFLRRHGWPQIVCLQEVKINSTDHATQRALKSAVNPPVAGDDHGPAYTVRVCLPRDKFNARGFSGKIYGVATLIREDSWELEVDNCREVDWDLEGRVLVLEMKSKLAIFNIYAVNGTDSPYRDSQSGAIVGTRHDRKLQFHKALMDECIAMEKRGFKVVLAGDFNIARSALDAHPFLRTSSQHASNRADFNEKFISGGLKAVDTFRHLHGDLRKFTYYPRGKDWGAGCDRVDLVLISNGLQQSLLRSDVFDSPAERGPSDHVPLYIALDQNSSQEGEHGDASSITENSG
ncbi:MAG: hypothetical protein M1837_004436 [Sclerophora amabilis]|nr:MAG: hypothetical protein M1837_004436 [Sclerophora amabilis]